MAWPQHTRPWRGWPHVEHPPASREDKGPPSSLDRTLALSFPSSPLSRSIPSPPERHRRHAASIAAATVVPSPTERVLPLHRRPLTQPQPPDVAGSPYIDRIEVIFNLRTAAHRLRFGLTGASSSPLCSPTGS
uniref:Uncharacterized protein n=1 Tax=Triticum urartu TaxID=4572 RepID=A0A8R7P6S4_TRIUA